MTDATQRLRVLVVEDDEDLRALLTSILDEVTPLDGRRLELVEATNLATAIDELDDGDVDVVLLDLTLPDASGMQAVLEVTDRAPTVAVIVLTAAVREGLELEVLTAGADGFLAKPGLTRQRLVDALRRTIAREQNVRNRADRLLAEATQQRQLELGDALSTRGRLDPPLAEALPSVHATAIKRWQSVVERGVRERILQSEAQAEAELRGLVRELALARATSHDVATIHVEALRGLSADQPPKRARALLEVGGPLLTQALGLLAMHYRERLLQGDVEHAP